MTALSQWKVALYLAAIFCAGGVSGWVVAAKSAKQRMSAPPWDRITASTRERLRSGLHLTPEQTQQVDAIIERSSAEMKVLFDAQSQRIRQAVDQRNAQITAVLTPEQRQQFEQMQRERQEAWRARRAGHDGHRGPRDRGPTNGPAGTNRVSRTTDPAHPPPPKPAP